MLRGGEAFVFSGFSRNQGKTKPLTWWSVSSLLPSQAAQNLTASRHNLVAIQLSIKTSFTWRFELLYLIFIHFRLAVPCTSDQTQTNVWNEPRWFETMAGPAAPFHSFRTASERPALCLFASLNQHPRNSDVMTVKSALKSLGCPIVMSGKPLMLLDSNTKLQPIMHTDRKRK